jgi:hypothetical protein
MTFCYFSWLGRYCFRPTSMAALSSSVLARCVKTLRNIQSCDKMKLLYVSETLRHVTYIHKVFANCSLHCVGSKQGHNISARPSEPGRAAAKLAPPPPKKKKKDLGRNISKTFYVKRPWVVFSATVFFTVKSEIQSIDWKKQSPIILQEILHQIVLTWLKIY